MNGACWIWADKEQAKDTYVSFKDGFNYNGGNIVLKVCAETNYIAFLNGKRVGFGQFAGFPYCKYYDVLDLTNACVNGENHLEIVVWYEGLDTFTHIEDGAGLIYSVEVGGKQIAFSSENTLSGIDNSYVQGREKLLTIQIGYTSTMNAEKQVV